MKGKFSMVVPCAKRNGDLFSHGNVKNVDYGEEKFVKSKY